MSNSNQIKISHLGLDSIAVIDQVLKEYWHSDFIVSRGLVHRASDLEGIRADVAGKLQGLLTFRVFEGSMEITSLDAFKPNLGIGTALIKFCLQVAQERKCRRIWLITSNDNLEALRFYQKRGFSLVCIHRGAIDLARKIKPSIPLIGNFEIPITDEIELERVLDS